MKQRGGDATFQLTVCVLLLATVVLGKNGGQDTCSSDSSRSTTCVALLQRSKSLSHARSIESAAAQPTPHPTPSGPQRSAATARPVGRDNILVAVARMALADKRLTSVVPPRDLLALLTKETSRVPHDSPPVVLESASGLSDIWSFGKMKEFAHIHALFVPVLLGFFLLAMLALSMCDCAGSSRKDKDSVAVPGQLQSWSVLGILTLTSYKFYTGFLSATWMPFLLAMEGQELMNERQSVFMGTAKLIYGFSIVLNPVFGLLGDQVATSSRWNGRRMFVLVGVGCSGLGIYGCMVAAQTKNVHWYYIGTVLWMIGEALADVTTEALVPELLPPHQYSVSSALRGLNFLVGGLVGYACLIFLRDVHYSWLYYGYLIVMVACTSLSLCFIGTEDLKPVREVKEINMRTLLMQAYVVPANYVGGFPRACLCVFFFSLGSAPMFFMLLMIRDLALVEDEAKLQFHFASVSMVFFVAAAVASVYLSASSSSAAPPREEGRSESAAQIADGEESQRAGLAWRWKSMFLTTISFGIVMGVFPVVGLGPTEYSRIAMMYILAPAFGFSFGCVYCKFQECTWSLLPTDVNIANAMGFAAMCKLAGVGIGNFLAGGILDFYDYQYKGGHHYQYQGYVVLHLFCMGCVFTSAWLLRSVWSTAVSKQRAAPSMNVGG